MLLDFRIPHLQHHLQKLTLFIIEEALGWLINGPYIDIILKDVILDC